MIPLADTHDCTGIQSQDPCCWSLFGSSQSQDPLQTHDRSAHRHGGHRVLKWGPRLILRKRCLKLIKNPAHLVIYVEPKDWSGQRTVHVKVVTPRDPTSRCSKPHCKVNLVLVETHGGLMPEADYLLRGNVWEPVIGEYVLKFCSEISSATMWLFRNNNLDLSFQ